MSYKICGCTFRSNIPLPELTPGDERQPEFTFELCTERKDFSESCHWLNHWYALDGSIWLSFAKLDAAYLLHFPTLVDFVVSSDARTVSCFPQADCPPETMRHLLLNQVIPIVLSHLGKLVLHASACATPQGVMAFMGTTGMGKSTLAAGFGLQGLAVLSDDCTLVEEQNGEAMTVPSYPGLRLWPETVTALFEQEPMLQPLAHYTDKKRLIFEQDHFDGPLSLQVVYVLTPENMQDITDVTITPLGNREALLEIAKHTFQLDVTHRQKLGQAFRQYEWLAKTIPFFRLAFPRDYASLSVVNTAILNHLDLIQNQGLTASGKLS